MASIDADFLFESYNRLNSLSAFLLETTAFSDFNMGLSNILATTKTHTNHQTRTPPQNRYTAPMTVELQYDNAIAEPAVSVESASTMRPPDMDDNYIAVTTYVNRFLLPYFILEVPSFDPNTIDFDKLGILYQFSDYLYIVCETMDPESGRPTIRHAWVSMHLPGPYLMREWVSLPKVRVSRTGQGVLANDGWWHVHSATIQKLRLACLMIAQEVELGIEGLKGGVDQELESRQHAELLGFEFGRIVDAMYETLEAKEEEALKASEKLMEEFMVFEE